MGLRVQRGTAAPTQLDRIEAKLDALAELLASLSEPADEEVDEFSGERDQSQPL